jgi:hypothetical protein
VWVAVDRALDVSLLVLAVPVEHIHREAHFLVEVITICNKVPVEATVVIVKNDGRHRALDAKDTMNHGLANRISNYPFHEQVKPAYNSLWGGLRPKEGLASNNHTTRMNHDLLIVGTAPSKKGSDLAIARLRLAGT